MTNLFRTYMFFVAIPLFSQNGQPIPLWANGAPGSESMANIREVVDPKLAAQNITRVSSIHRPSLLAFLPPKETATGAAVIVAPGGGHRFLSLDSEGTNFAKPLNQAGIAVFVLKYRLAKEEGSPYKVEVEALADAQRAIRTLRTRASEWNLNPAKIAIMGFSAGGELAALASTRFDAGNPSAPDPLDRPSSRPDYQILIYPGSPSANVIVTKDTPPTFMLCADNDKGPSEAIATLYPALKKAGVPTEVHIYLKGGHGFGLRDNPKPGAIVYRTWLNRLQEWIGDVGMSGQAAL